LTLDCVDVGKDNLCFEVLRLFIGGGVEYPLDYAPVWMYSRKDALKGPEMAAVAELKKVFEESERVAAEREKQ